MSGGTIEFACPYCERITRVPSAFGGKQGKCPGCQKVIEVPNPAAEDAAPPAPAPAEAGVANSSVSGKAAAGGGDAGAPVPDWQQQHVKRAPAQDEVAGPDGDALRACPMCGEQIKAIAKKCKFCGEFLDRRLREQRSGRQPDTGGRGVLASPLVRFGARLVDFLLDLPAVALGIVGVVLIAQGQGRSVNPVGVILIGLGVLVYFALMGYQWYLISTRGQTLAKTWLDLKIVKIDGTDVDFVSGVILRIWVNFFIGLIPYVGGWIQLAGYLPIFAQDHRCLHDHIAGTRVIEASSDDRRR